MLPGHAGEVAHHEGVDIRTALQQHLVVDGLTEDIEHLRQHIDVAPGELPESCGITFIGQLPGDAARDFRHPGKRAHRVVGHRLLGKAQVKHLELPGPARPAGLGIQARQQIAVPFGIKHDDHVATADILTGDHFQQAGFADPCGADDKGVGDSFGLLQGDVLLLLEQADSVQFRAALDIGPRWKGVQQPLAVQWCHQRFQGCGTDGVHRRPYAPIGQTAAVEIGVLGALGIGVALGMPRIPQKTPAQKQLALRGTEFFRVDAVTRQHP